MSALRGRQGWASYGVARRAVAWIGRQGARMRDAALLLEAELFTLRAEALEAEAKRMEATS